MFSHSFSLFLSLPPSFSFCVSRSGFYRPRKLGHSFPRLYDIVEGEAIATMFLQLNPEERVGAEDALLHKYFAPLPRKLYELPDGELKRIQNGAPSVNEAMDQRSIPHFALSHSAEASIFSVEGVYIYPEPNRQNK